MSTFPALTTNPDGEGYDEPRTRICPPRTRASEARVGDEDHRTRWVLGTVAERNDRPFHSLGGPQRAGQAAQASHRVGPSVAPRPQASCAPRTPPEARTTS